MPIEIKNPRVRRKQVKQAWQQIEGLRVDQLTVDQLKILLTGIAYLNDITDGDLKIQPIEVIVEKRQQNR